MLKYGTDGWYAVISDDFTMDNVAKASRAAAIFLIRHQLQAQPIVVGYDTRFLSDKFAAAVVRAFTAGGLNCLLVERETPVPVIAWEVKDREAGGGLVITGACLPIEQNGLRLIAPGGRPLTAEEAKEVDMYLFLERSSLNANVPSANLLAYQEGVSFLRSAPKGSESRFEPRERYLKYLHSQVDGHKIEQAGLKIVVDPIYGATRGYFDRFLQELGCRVATIHEHRDVLFGGRDPMPVGENLAELQAKVLGQGANFGLALCPSGERFGLVDKQGAFHAEGEVLPQISAYAAREKGLSPAELKGNALLAGALLVEMAAAKIVL
jgi:phosphomannomutase